MNPLLNDSVVIKLGSLCNSLSMVSNIEGSNMNADFSEQDSTIDLKSLSYNDIQLIYDNAIRFSKLND
jgi:hypothetical protein